MGCLSEANRNSEFKLIEQAFNDSDKLRLLNYLSQFMQIKSEDFLTRKPLVGGVREWIVALVSAVPVIISLIQLFLPDLKL
jgi:hypothetical protein